VRFDLDELRAWAHAGCPSVDQWRETSKSTGLTGSQ
jgi:hypothetical protein